MDIEHIIKHANPNIIIFLMTSLIAFLSWLIKSLVEKPISESKSTFNKFLEKRIEILTEVKTRLSFIAYFAKGKENLEFKEQLQSIILKDGKIGYLSKDVFNDVLKISIEAETDEKLLFSTIDKIDSDLYAQISKIQDEISFYRKFSNYNPLRRFVGLTLLSLSYIISLSLILAILCFLILAFLDGNYCLKIVIMVLSGIAIFFIGKWLKK